MRKPLLIIGISLSVFVAVPVVVFVINRNKSDDAKERLEKRRQEVAKEEKAVLQTLKPDFGPALKNWGESSASKETPAKKEN